MARTRRAAAGDGPRIEERLVEGARALVTVGPESVAWASPADFVDAVAPRTFEGAIVRLCPPPGADEAAVARVADLVRSRGASAVRTVRTRRAVAIVDRDLKPDNIRKPHLRAREVVAAVLAEAKVEDPAALAAFVEDAMGRAGL